MRSSPDPALLSRPIPSPDASDRSRAIVEAALDAVLTMDAAGLIVDLNASAERLFGYSRDVAIGKSMADLIIPSAFRDRHRAGFARHLATGTSRILGRRMEMPAMRADGRLIPVELEVDRIEVEGCTFFTAFLRDITERRRAEEEQARLSAIVESSDDAIIATTISGVILNWNRGAERMYGYAASEVRGRTIDFLETEERHGELGAIVERVRRSRNTERYETARRRKDGEVVYVSVVLSPLRNSAGAVVGLTSIARDISEKKRAEEALRDSRAFLEQAQEVGHIGSWVSGLSEDDRLDWSAETCRIFGVAPDEFDGRIQTFFSFVHPEDRDPIRTAVQRALALDEPYSIEHRIVRRDGTLRWVHERANVIRDEARRPVRLVGTVQDVTERRELEEQLLQAQKLDAIGRLAGGIAHDFNNLLTAILGYSSELLTRLDPEHPGRGDVEEIRSAGERAAALTRQLLAFSRKQSLVPELVDLNAVVTNLEKMLRRVIGEDIDLITETGVALAPIRADPGQIEQVILNLAVNARDAMPSGGTLRIRTGAVEFREPRVFGDASLPAGSYVLLSVRDDGVGMDTKTRRRIFEPFFTTKEKGKGTGLGLSTVHGIVRQSGGAIDVESESGRGTAFRIYLPRFEEAKAGPAVPKAAAEDSRGRETVLLVEDESAIRQLLQKVLESKGYTVIACDRGEAALQVLESRPAPVHLLLTDVVMPGMTGPELAARIAAIRPATRVLLMSGYADRVAQEGVGFDKRWPLIEKPFKPDAVARTIREVLDGDP
jgi:two-component system, cell cycle sensor histidine kinase and response regulator CckA